MQIQKWLNQEQINVVYRAPYKQLRSLANDYFILQDKLNKKSISISDRLDLTRDFQKSLLTTLGYQPQIKTIEFSDGHIPLLGQISNADGSPLLWIIESFSLEPRDILENKINRLQIGQLDNLIEKLDFDGIITSIVFTSSEPPRWIILLGDNQLVLIDRAKWAQKRYLRFDFGDIFGRKEENAFKAMAALLHQDSLAPQSGISLLDTLDENSHKHAFAVSEDLKYSLRQAIEELANEAIYYKQSIGEEVQSVADLSEILTRESLRYMYRLLFVFYIESRSDLGYVPVKSESYLKGYSLETLRDLELRPLLISINFGKGFTPFYG